MNKIADIRKDYQLKTLQEQDAAPHAISQFSKWWNEAIESAIDEVNACTLATATANGKPSARIVLLKGYDDDGFSFFTNYESAKGHELSINPQAAMVFFWKELQRQVRIEGVVEKLSAAQSDAYFISRPAGSRIGAWASPQSQKITGRAEIEENEKKYQRLFTDGNIPRPPHWGGYLLEPRSVEFWQGRTSRLHDRLLYTLQQDGSWKIERLAP